MKKVLLSLCCVLAAVSLCAAGEDFYKLGSLENRITAGGFSNEIDDQFSAGSAFGSYDRHFIYGGLGNPGAGAMKQGGKASQTLKDEINFGYYMPWKFPMSFYIRFQASSNPGNIITPERGGTQKTWDSSAHGKVIKTKTTSYYAAPLFKESTFNFQYLVGLGTDMNFVAGFQFAYSGDKTNFVPANNVKTTYKDMNTPANSYTEHSKTITESDVDTAIGSAAAFKTFTQGGGNIAALPELVDSFSFRIPVAFTTGKFEHTVALKIGSEIKSKNGYYYYNKNKKAIEKYANVSALTADTDLKLEYDISIPAADRETDSWGVGGSLGFDFKSDNQYIRYSYKDAAFSGKDGKLNITHKPQVGFEIDVHGSRALNFASPKKAVLFNVTPTLELKMHTAMNGGAYDEKISGSANINNAKYYYIKKTTGDPEQYKNKTKLTAEVSVPMGLRLLPENWKIGFLLGVKPSLETAVTVERDTAGNHKTQKSTTNDNGTVSTSGGTQYPGNAYDNTPTSKSYEWKVTEEHSIGITIPFEGGAHLDAELSGNLLDITSFKIQAFIPLGSGKKAASND